VRRCFRFPASWRDVSLSTRVDVIKLFSSSLTKMQIKLDHLSSARLSSRLVSLGKTTAYPSEAPSRCALPTNIRPAWKGLPRTNALNYICTFSVTNQIFMTLTPGQLLPSPLFLSRLKKIKTMDLWKE
jgi:hypothetical protein